MKQHNNIDWNAKYTTDLRSLPELARLHERNPNLLRIAHHALRAGRTIDQATDEIIAASGRPPLTDYEVRRALETASAEQESNRGRFVRRQPTSEERSFVRAMIEAGRGYTVDDFKNASPHLQGEVHIPRKTADNPSGAAVTQIQAMLAVDRECCDMRFDIMDQFWVGVNKSDGSLKTSFDLINFMGRGDHGLATIPNFVTCNALSGIAAPKKNGDGLTIRGDNCVVAKKLLLLEFDNLPHEEQLAFFGVVMSKGFFNVVSIVDSGNKSFHALVEVEGEYETFREHVKRLCCSAEDPRYRADTAVLHPSALTRLAGAYREDTRRIQELIYADFGKRAG